MTATCQTPTSVKSRERTYVRNVHAPFYARRFVSATLDAWHVTGLIETAELIASELATNAYQNGLGNDIAVRLECSGDSVCVRVWDGNPELPKPVAADMDSESGRGLMITAALADDWGFYKVKTGGKVVYAVITGIRL